MKLAVICFTQKGYEQMVKLKKCLTEYPMELFIKCSAMQSEDLQGVTYLENSIDTWAEQQFRQKYALLFIGAAGIAVRAIAPCVENKLYDSPVLVMDEQGGYVIPLLSGHIGGANELAEVIAKRLKSVPVITTATDLRHEFAVDVFAKKNRLTIKNKDGIAKVSRKVLEGKTVTMAIAAEHLPKDYLPADILIGGGDAAPKQALLYLEPKEYVIGIGCKKGKDAAEIQAFVQACLKEQHILVRQVACIASVDRKQEEVGILQLADAFQVPYVTFSVEELQRLKGDYQESDFVRETIGVGNICERAAIAACEHGGVLIQRKRSAQGITVAIAKRKWRIEFYET